MPLTSDHLSSEAFVLTSGDFARLTDLRYSHTQLGFALQLVTLRFLGTFLLDPTDVPAAVLDAVCVQLEGMHAGVLARYLNRPGMVHKHQREIQEHLDHEAFQSEQEAELVAWLLSSVQLEEVRPIELFDRCTARLVAHKVELPGASVLERLIVREREWASGELYHQLEVLLDSTQREALEGLLLVADEVRHSPLETLRDPPDRFSSVAMHTALERLERIRAVATVSKSKRSGPGWGSGRRHRAERLLLG